MLMDSFKELTKLLLPECFRVYGDSLVTLAIYGSVGRGTPSPSSDIDIMLVVSGLPNGRLKRMEQFRVIEEALEPQLDRLSKAGITTDLSPVIKTPEEVGIGSLLFLDMIEDAVILYDKDEFFAKYLHSLSVRLEKLGSVKVREGQRWHWVLKPDYKAGEVFEI